MRVNDFLFRPFYIANYGYNRNSVRLDLSRDKVFNKSLIVDISEENVEIPTIARVYYESTIWHNLQTPSSIERVVLPLYVNGTEKSRRTFDGIIREFFASTTFDERLVKVITGRGDVYYGGSGLILDENFEPLLMCGLKARKVPNENNMEYYRAVCYIHPKVFVEPSKLVNKGIIKKLIPLYTTADIRFPDDMFTHNSNNKKVEIIIDDFSRFFVSPIAPIPNKCNDSTLNKCLNDNIEEILNLIT